MKHLIIRAIRAEFFRFFPLVTEHCLDNLFGYTHFNPNVPLKLSFHAQWTFYACHKKAHSFYPGSIKYTHGEEKETNLSKYS